MTHLLFLLLQASQGLSFLSRLLFSGLFGTTVVCEGRLSIDLLAWEKLDMVDESGAEVSGLFEGTGADMLENEDQVEEWTGWRDGCRKVVLLSGGALKACTFSTPVLGINLISEASNEMQDETLGLMKCVLVV